MATADDVKARVAAAYNAAADCYDEPANFFWERFGRATIERLRPSTGSRVLDVCCGSGGSALPAAEMVGPYGSVLGIDLAARLLELARAKAAAAGLRNTQFRVGDILDLQLPESQFDAAVCVFGIFFVPICQQRYEHFGTSFVREAGSRSRRGARASSSQRRPHSGARFVR